MGYWINNNYYDDYDNFDNLDELDNFNNGQRTGLELTTKSDMDELIRLSVIWSHSEKLIAQLFESSFCVLVVSENLKTKKRTKTENNGAISLKGNKNNGAAARECIFCDLKNLSSFFP